MKVTVFPKCKAHPSCKEEKQSNAEKFSKFGETRDILNDNDLFNVITNFTWSPNVYKDSVRSEENFQYCEFLAIDVDDGLTIEDTKERLQNLKLYSFIAPSVSHTDEHHKFRVIFPLVKKITNKDEYKRTWEYVYKHYFPELDVKCSDLARFYFGCLDYEAYVIEGDLLEPKQQPREPRNMRYFRGLQKRMVRTETFKNKDILMLLYKDVPSTIPASVDYFFKNAHTGMEGEWICSLNSAVYTLSLQKVKEDDIMTAIEMVAPNDLDARDLKTIELAIKDGDNKRWE